MLLLMFIDWLLHATPTGMFAWLPNIANTNIPQGLYTFAAIFYLYTLNELMDIWLPLFLVTHSMTASYFAPNPFSTVTLTL